MQLLIRRGQTEGMLSPVFQLWARFELKEEELALLNKYKMGGAIITEGNTKHDLIKALIYGLILALLVSLIIGFLPVRLPIIVTFILPLILFPLFAYFIYEKIREQIKVNDILDGRSFNCNSIGVLMEKEEKITETAVMFRQFLEAMKNWGGNRAIQF
jgi:hypothetical protein